MQADGQCAVEGCHYQLIKEDRFEEACRLISEHYCPDEPLCKCFGLVMNQDHVMKAMTMDDLHQNMSIALISNETNEMVGIQVLCISKKGKINPDDYKESDAGKKLMSFIAYKDSIMDVFEYYDADEVFSLFELTVRRDYRRRGIGRKLLQATIILISSMNIGPCVLKGNCSSNFSKSIYEKLSFDTLGEIKFADYTVDGEQVIPVGTRRRFNVEVWLKFRRDVVSTLIQR